MYRVQSAVCPHTNGRNLECAPVCKLFGFGVLCWPQRFAALFAIMLVVSAPYAFALPWESFGEDWEPVADATIAGRYQGGAFAGGEQDAHPTLVDIDNDGDLDLFVGVYVDPSPSRAAVSYYENLGSARNPRWSFPDVQYQGILVGDFAAAAPSFTDIDGDGDKDLVVGSRNSLFYFENTGTAARATFSLNDTNFASIATTSITNPKPTFVDIDNDGDNDLFVGIHLEGIRFYENTGSPTNPSWAAPSTNYAELGAVRTPAPTFRDMDGDGDVDLFVGSSDEISSPSWSTNGVTYYVENTGTATVAAWAPVVSIYLPYDFQDYSVLAFGDTDADGDQDLLVGSAGGMYGIENIGSATNALWGARVNDAVYVDLGFYASPTFADIDDDGDLDLFAGEDSQALMFYENKGALTVPLWGEREAWTNITAGTRTQPVFVDIDDDEDLDLVLGQGDGSFTFWENIGSKAAPAWHMPPSFLDPFNGLNVGYDSAPAFFDIDDDGDYDFFSGDRFGDVTFFENTGSASSPSWAASSTNYAGIDGDYHSRLTFLDADRDGDGDIFVMLAPIPFCPGDDTQSEFLFYENTGTAANAMWAPPIANATNIFAPLGGGAPALADLDDDGDADLMLGNCFGGLTFYRNNETKVNISPPLLTMEPERSNTFHILAADTGTVTWSFIQNNSGAIIDTNGTYVAGTNVPAIDVIRAFHSYPVPNPLPWLPPATTNETFGRAHINVIDPADAAAVGKAIVIAGAKAADDPVWTATDLVAGKAYLTLLRRGFAKTNIYYLSFDPNQDVDGDGLLDDIDGASSLANASYAFSTFANNADKLFVFLADHGSDSAGEGYMRLSPAEQLSATQLNSWVSSLQNSDTNLDVTIAMDFCYSGSFLDELTYTGSARRVNIASADTNELTYFIAGGLVSFSDAFLTALQLGYDFNNAFLVARGAMSTYQLAQMDDNKDGVYQSGVDGANATNRLGATFVAGQDIPQIGTINPNQTITTGTTVTLYADDVSSVFPIERVWCLIVPPSHAPDTGEGVPVLDIPEVELDYNTSESRYEADFSGFTEQGVYKVIFIAKDIWDNVSIPKQSYINQGNYDERAIIVAGGPGSDPNWSNITFIAQATYNVLEARLFDHDSIYYISADTNIDIDADGTNDVDAAASLNAISNAISTWASTADRLNIFLIGDGTNNQLRVTGSQILDAGSFDAWIDDFQTSDRDVNIVMDFDGSGGFATNLVPPSGKERINIASTRPNRTSVMREGGLVSFSQYFLTEIFGGKTIGDATTKARKAIRRASGRVRQRGGIDDDGDGKLNEKNVDGVMARQRYIGAAFATGDDSPNIAQVVPDTALTNTSSFTIWVADVTDVDGISNVWCVITPPDYDGFSELPREDLAYDAGDDRYEALYTNFSQAGSYQLTFYASDNLGEVSPAVQSTVARADEYEDDDTYLTASILNGDIFQFHSFHDEDDRDWIRFYAVSNYEYEIETFHFSTNVDTVLNVYQQLTDGSLVQIVTNEDEYGFDEGELTGLSFPTSGFYYVEVSQFITNGSGQGSYEVLIWVPSGDGAFAIVAGDDFTGQPLPPGSYALIDGVSNAFNGAPAIAPILSPGPHTIEVICPSPGYHPREAPDAAGQVGNAANMVYGNPRVPVALQAEEGEVAGGVLFMYRCYTTVKATVRDKMARAYLEDAPPVFDAHTGFLTNYAVNKRPLDGDYATPWKTSVDGDFPVTVLAPAVDSDLVINLPGYEPYTVTNVVSHGQVGLTNSLGMIELMPLDTNSNGIADSWEALHYPGTNYVAGVDTDGDGHTDDEEYKLGTDPNSATNVMAADEMMSTNGFTLVWPVQNGRTYQVGCAINLLTNWQVIAGPWQATATQTWMQWTDTNSVNATSCSYRIELVAP